MPSYFMSYHTNVDAQEWQSTTTFRRGVVVTYGITAAVLSYRGLAWDAYTHLPHHLCTALRLVLQVIADQTSSIRDIYE